MKTAPFNADVLGVKIWYDDGVVLTIPAYQLPEQWDATRQDGVQVVSIYDREPIKGQFLPQWFASYDYYALSPTAGFIETNRPSDLPKDASVKIGSMMDKDAFRALYNKAMHDHEF